LTSKFRVDLLITEEIRRTLDDRCRLRPMPAALLKGKAEPIHTVYVDPDAVPRPGSALGETGRD
jgi:hypothetical protein